MKNILIISELEDFLNTKHTHYSFNKGFEFAKGLVNIDNLKIYYLTTGNSQLFEKINLINILEINDDFINNLNYLILVRETNLLEILNIESLGKIIKNSPHIYKIIKSDSIVWLNNKVYTKHFIRRHTFLEFINNNFNKIGCQTEIIKKNNMNYLSTIYGKSIKKIKDKIFISKMGIPNKYPVISNLDNPYDINHSYCVKDQMLLIQNKALLPIIINENFNKKKIILVYMGRIKTDQGKILYLMRDIMKELGDDYELHIFPGKFVIPDTDLIEKSPKDRNNLKELQEKIFSESSNVIIHFPFFDNISKSAYLQNADIGIDFSPSRPNDLKHNVGNAKLLEFCYYGLKVVCEKNIGNSELVEIGKNGILLDGIATCKDYVNAIINIKETQINKDFTINQTINYNNWDIIAKDFYENNMCI